MTKKEFAQLVLEFDFCRSIGEPYSCDRCRYRDTLTRGLGRCKEAMQVDMVHGAREALKHWKEEEADAVNNMQQQEL